LHILKEIHSYRFHFQIMFISVEKILKNHGCVTSNNEIIVTFISAISTSVIDDQE
jgi:hypothetical protein